MKWGRGRNEAPVVGQPANAYRKGQCGVANLYTYKHPWCVQITVDCSVELDSHCSLDLTVLGHNNISGNKMLNKIPSYIVMALSNVSKQPNKKTVLMLLWKWKNLTSGFRLNLPFVHCKTSAPPALCCDQRRKYQTEAIPHTLLSQCRRGKEIT